MLWIETENHSLYNRLMTYITDPSARQMFQQLREAKMRSITLIQEEIKKGKSK
ncbi:MAG: spore coat protein [Firmicutes bacterium]|nr:spore coat protein [Bacillota bacterium]